MPVQPKCLRLQPVNHQPVRLRPLLLNFRKRRCPFEAIAAPPPPSAELAATDMAAMAARFNALVGEADRLTTLRTLTIEAVQAGRAFVDYVLVIRWHFRRRGCICGAIGFCLRAIYFKFADSRQSVGTRCCDEAP